MLFVGIGCWHGQVMAAAAGEGTGKELEAVKLQKQLVAGHLELQLILLENTWQKASLETDDEQKKFLNSLVFLRRSWLELPISAENKKRYDALIAAINGRYPKLGYTDAVITRLAQVVQADPHLSAAARNKAKRRTDPSPTATTAGAPRSKQLRRTWDSSTTASAMASASAAAAGSAPASATALAAAVYAPTTGASAVPSVRGRGIMLATRGRGTAGDSRGTAGDKSTTQPAAAKK